MPKRLREGLGDVAYYYHPPKQSHNHLGSYSRPRPSLIFKVGYGVEVTYLCDSHCACVVLIKAFSVLLLQACHKAIFLLYIKRFFPFDQNAMPALCVMVFVLIARGKRNKDRPVRLPLVYF